MSTIKRLGYLSAAPRVSTHPEAEASGPRAHVLGVMRAFQALEWEVLPFIVGDRVPPKWRGKGSEKAVSGSFLGTLAADLIRLILGTLNALKAWRELGGKVDWVYERFAALQSLGWIFQRQGVPWILETSGPFFYEAKFERKSVVLSSVARWMEIQAYRQCDVLVCVSEALKEIVVCEAKIPPEKVVLVPNGVDTEFFNPELYQPKRLFAEFTIGFVGTLTNWQGLDLLLYALKDLQAEGITLCSIVVGDGLMLEEWRALAQNLGVSTKVAFVGRVPRYQVPEYIAGFDVGYSGQIELQMGTMYHSPLKLYEYMAMGKPVIASAFEDAQRALRQNETGFLFPAGNLAELKQTLLSAYEARERLHEMGGKARAEVLAEHSWIARVEKMIEDVDRILQVKER